MLRSGTILASIVPDRRGEPRARSEKEACDNDRQRELERSRAGAAGDRKNGSRQWFQMRCELAEGGLEIIRGHFPEVMQLHADQRPVTDAIRRRRDRQISRGQLIGDVSQPVDQSEAEPGRRSRENGEYE